MLEIVRKQFFKVKWQPFAHPYDQLDTTRERISGPKDQFQPRTLAPEKRKATNGNKVLANLLHTLLLQAIDGIPGLTALTREQMAPLASEQALKQTGALWGAAWTFEGEPSRVKAIK